MKTRLVTLIFVLLSAIAYSQSDTIPWGHPDYFWDAYINPDSVDLADYIMGGSYDHSEEGYISEFYCQMDYKHFVFTDKDSLTIYGMACLVVNNNFPFGYPINDSLKLRLLIGPASPQYSYFHATEVASYSFLPREYTTVSTHDRVFHYHYTNSVGPYAPLNEPKTARLYEFYFATPVTVYDTFWMGFSPNLDDTQWTLAPYSDPVGVWTYYIEYYTLNRVWLPIIRPRQVPLDTVPGCPASTPPEVMEADGGFVALRWQHAPNTEGLEVAFGTDTINADNNPIRTYSRYTTADFFTSLDTGLYYAAYTRSLCHHSCANHDTTFYSDWSAPTIFYLGTLPGGGTSGGDTPIGNDTIWVNDSTFVVNGDTTIISGGTTEMIPLTPQPDMLHLYPNPTRDAVTLHCGDAKIETIEVIDRQGRRVMRADAPTSPTLHLRHLPAGIYYIKAITSQGSNTQPVTLLR